MYYANKCTFNKIMKVWSSQDFFKVIKRLISKTRQDLFDNYNKHSNIVMFYCIFRYYCLNIFCIYSGAIAPVFSVTLPFLLLSVLKAVDLLNIIFF